MIGLLAADPPARPVGFDSVLACAGSPSPSDAERAAVARASSPPYTASSLREYLPQSCLHPSSSRSDSRRL
ncbi:MAG: hypothetical protein L0323_21610, partial [Planctomycetes bacterium]|nr:hypothetical protein [Planctomycetota bacterium]